MDLLTVWELLAAVFQIGLVVAAVAFVGALVMCVVEDWLKRD